MGADLTLWAVVAVNGHCGEDPSHALLDSEAEARRLWAKWVRGAHGDDPPEAGGVESRWGRCETGSLRFEPGVEGWVLPNRPEPEGSEGLRIVVRRVRA